MFFDQDPFDVRCEWGLAGVEALQPRSDAIIVVDVLSFTTSVDIATSRGAVVLPYPWRDHDRATDFALMHRALLARAGRRRSGSFTLSPESLLGISAGTRLVLPSPNGATLSLATGTVPTLAGCLWNAEVVARAALQYGNRIGVIPAGEHWEHGGLRPGLEDLVGAGAIIHHLPGSRSPEAEAAVAAYRRFEDDLVDCLRHCGSGRELIGHGFARDVELAGQLNCSHCAPVLVDGAYVRQNE